ncbi:MAG TPA: hypothetical protein VFJ28_09435 [Marmoricola sp.]|nr:hypothetical protein [Marmoricola sp.]
MKTARSASRHPAPWLVLLVAMVILAILAATSQGTTGPNQVSIASTGGYNACLTGIADGDEYAVFRSIQGTRHPYQGASYTINNSVIGVTPQIGNDSSYYIYEGAPIMKIMRVDNQAATSGNGLYECKAIP